MGLKIRPSWKPAVVRDFQRMQEVARELKEDRERAGEEATFAASKLAKDTGASTEQAASLVEEARDSAVEEARKLQSMVWLLLIGLGMLYLYFQLQQGSP